MLSDLRVAGLDPRTARPPQTRLHCAAIALWLWKRPEHLTNCALLCLRSKANFTSVQLPANCILSSTWLSIWPLCDRLPLQQAADPMPLLFPQIKNLLGSPL